MSEDFELTPLQQDLVDAIRMNRVAAVEDCIAKGSGVKFTAGYFGETPLHLAAQSNRPEIIALLVEKGAPVDIPDLMGQTPLFHAAEKGHVESVKQLLSLKANPHHVANTSRTALFGPSMYGHVPVIEALTAAGADPNFAVGGSTPIFLAVNGSHYEAAITLVKAGARVDAHNSAGQTAGEVALKKCSTSDYRPDTLLAQFLNAAKLQGDATGGTEKSVTILKPLQFKLK
ncbi:MAG: ankyrin repeat domain-containing protein [Alphaproteobacteria bacterium]|nr:MAG: ankyrin repeat domain-containing protein [Alphaproteobacteria bacterium]